MKHIMQCPECQSYTLKNNCPKCDNKTIMPRPAKYSPQDKYAKYRRIAKKQSSSKQKSHKETTLQ